MQCVEITGAGEPDVLRLVERPDPVPAPGEVLIRVAAAGINRPDLLQRRGSYPPPPGVSDLPGLEVAGVVQAVGAGVSRWREGDEVCALVAGGGYATLCLAPEAQCLPSPVWSRSDHGCRHPRNVLHRLDECLRTGKSGRRGIVAGARRIERHRYHGHPTRLGARRARVCDRWQRREVPRLRSSLVPTARSTTAPPTSWTRSAG